MENIIKDKNKCFLKNVLALFSLVFFFVSCSLDYGKEMAVESSLPEINFFGATMKRTEDRKVTIEMKAGQLEQYKNSDVSFAKEIEFKTWSKAGEKETEGKCDLLSIDRGHKQYNLFGNIELLVCKENMRIGAKNLMWNGKREQLVSSAGDEVSIFKDDFEVKGKGFVASGVSKSFSFNDTVNGEINQADENPEGESE